MTDLDEKADMEPLLDLLRSLKRKRTKKLRAAMLGGAEDIDPVGCGCTHCLTGVTRPAGTHLEYEIARALGVAR